MRRPTHRFVLPALIAALALAACAEREDEAPAGGDAGAALSVSLVPAEVRAVDRSVVAAGPVAAWQEMQLGVELSGSRVTALHVE
ncbi:MAG TPA: hypothetical protein VFO79_02235, partial [Xanthomonadales bacterium]|nr:hypothetical protein [Xanthomonadales bacterium]